MDIRLKRFCLSIHSLTAALLIIAVVSVAVILVSLRGITALHAKEQAIKNEERACSAQVQRLADTSDYLTSEVWHYVSTQDTKYMLNYWHEVQVSKNREDAVRRLVELKACKSEIELVTAAKGESDRLIYDESYAMRLIAESVGMKKENMPKRVAEVTLSPKDTSLSPKAKVQAATDLIFGYKYSLSKQEIMGNIERLRRHIEQRKDAETAKAEAETQSAVFATMLLCIFILLLFLVLVGEYYLLINTPFKKYSQTLSLLLTDPNVRLEPHGCLEMKKFAKIFNDVFSRLQKTNTELREMSGTDYLTKLSSRATFENYITGLSEKERSCLFIVVIDISKFKLINNAFGRMTGDMALRKVGALLKSMVTSEIGMPARLGGQEFVAAIVNRPKEECFAMAEAILKNISELNLRGVGNCGANTFLSSNIGCVFATDNSYDLNRLLTKADLALSRAKENGKNTYFCFSTDDPYFAEMAKKRQNEACYEKEMWNSLLNNDFIPYFQPKYDLVTGGVIGIEALVRWQHPRLGFLSPDSFIPFFERNGFICDIDFYMFEQSCKVIRNWLARNMKAVPIAVNFSWRHLQQPDFADKLLSITKQYNIAPSYIDIEMTETSLTKNWEESIATTKKLRDFGFSLAIDDFGCGYSSLSMLRDFSVDYLKIDKSFLDMNGSEPKNLTIIQSILRVCGVLGIKAICEGIETEAQNCVLKQNGCPYGQGYYFSRPLTLDKLEEFMKIHA